jgi:phospholipid transport system substrate-binding protein
MEGLSDQGFVGVVEAGMTSGCPSHAVNISAHGAKVSRRRISNRWLAIVALVVAYSLGVAQPVLATSPTATLEAFFARTNAVLQSADPAEGIEAPRQAIRVLVNEVFDFRAAAAVALGPVWLSKVPEDQDKFTRLFAVFLERGFVAMVGSKASVAGGVSVRYLGESIDGESAGVATTLLTRGGHELPVDYWMVRRGDRWKVQDVVVDGVSLVMNYRAQFSRVLAAHPYAELVARMQPETSPEPPPAAALAAQSPPSTQPGAGGAELPPAVVRDVPADRSAKPKVVKAGQPQRQIPKSKSGGAKRGGPSGAEPPVAARVAAPGDTQQPVDVVGRLLVRSRSGAERDVAALLARAGGSTLSRQRGPTVTVVKGVVPHSSYGNFAAGLRGIGSWQIEVERSPLPTVLRVTVRLAE